MSIEQIDQFEVANRIAVNVYELDENERVVALRASTFDAAPERVVDLLLIERGETRHYCLIQNLPKLLQNAGAIETTSVKLPAHIEAKNACVNILCNDGKSFKWCVLAHKYPVANNQRPEHV